MNIIRLFRGSEAIGSWVLGSRPLEVGRAASCDIAIEEAEIAARALLVLPQHGSVFLRAIDDSGALCEARVMPLGTRVAVGRHHALRRDYEPGGRSSSEAPPDWGEGGAAFELSVGDHQGARRVSVQRPIQVGSDPACDLVLCDAEVEAFHLRLEPCESGVVLRDLSQKGGVWLQGLQVYAALLRAQSCFTIGRSSLYLRRRGVGEGAQANWIAESPRIVETLAQAKRYARLDWPALIRGESGAGKEEIARTLHFESSRAKGPFVAVNAAALLPSLADSELFGHERGSFTGALQQHKGLFEQAQGGTLFLDEVGELPPSLQARLLRVLERFEIRRVGGRGDQSLDLRVVCATHRDLRAMVAAETFRADLYFRIARLVIEVPPLRERPEDILALSRHFLSQSSVELGPRRLSREANHRLLAYPWPGNVRELRNVVTTAALMPSGELIDAREIDLAIERVALPSSEGSAEEALPELLERFKGNVSALSRALGVPRSTLRDRLRHADAQRSPRASMAPPASSVGSALPEGALLLPAA